MSGGDNGNSNGNGNGWLSPGVLFGVIGMAGAIIAAWISFESRVTRVEVTYAEMNDRFDRMEQKLDRLIEERAK